MRISYWSSEVCSSDLRVQVRPIEDLDLLYRFRLDKDDLNARRSELLLDVGPPALNLNLSYFFIKDDTIGDEFGDREEASFGIRSRLNENWSIRFQHRRDLIEIGRASCRERVCQYG